MKRSNASRLTSLRQLASSANSGQPWNVLRSPLSHDFSNSHDSLQTQSFEKIMGKGRKKEEVHVLVLARKRNSRQKNVSMAHPANQHDARVQFGAARKGSGGLPACKTVAFAMLSLERNDDSSSPK